jgi:glyoxylase-like metal-dependent hydrolase (beta-lactamase superfamily II)
MYFRQILHDDRHCASYLVGCPTLSTCAAIDPQGDPQAYVDQAGRSGMKITAVFDTHVHADHVSTAKELAESTGARLYYGPGAAVKFPHEELKDGQVVEVGRRRITVMHTPGHTPEHVCLAVDDWLVLTGDTLFVGDVGRVDLSLDSVTDDDLRERASRLHSSLQRLRALPDITEVYPGHYAGSVCGRGMDSKPISTVGHERKENEPFSLPQREFVEYELRDLPRLPDEFALIKRKNLGL